jgi:hypothetical protein
MSIWKLYFMKAVFLHLIRHIKFVNNNYEIYLKLFKVYKYQIIENKCMITNILGKLVTEHLLNIICY